MEDAILELPVVRWHEARDLYEGRWQIVHSEDDLMLFMGGRTRGFAWFGESKFCWETANTTIENHRQGECDSLEQAKNELLRHVLTSVL